MIITSLELETELGELSLVAKLGVVLLEDVILGLKVLRLVTDPLGGVRLGKLLELLEVFLGKVDNCNKKFYISVHLFGERRLMTYV